MLVAVTQNDLERILSVGLLLLMRIGSAVVTMPVFSSPSIPARVKALLTVVFVLLLAPVVAFEQGVEATLNATSLLAEVAVGLGFGLTLALLNEALLFAAALMGTAFSFSLANLLDPNSLVETEVLGTVLSWLGVLVLLGAGLHRTMLAALLRTLDVVPLGHASTAMHNGSLFASMASGIFASGVQLAAPVISAALLVEVAVGIVSRMAPALPAQIASVPVKTLVSYVVLVGSLALWPRWIEHHFVALLNAAQKGVHG